MQTATQTEQTNVGGVNLTGLPVEGAAVPQLNLAPAPTEAELAAAAELKAKQIEATKAEILKQQETQKLSLTRFEATTGFSLETEVIGGGAFKRSTTKKGSFKVQVAGKKDMKLASGGMTGTALEDYTRMRQDELKGKQSLVAAKLAGDNSYTGALLEVSDKGDVIIKWKKVAAMTVGLAEPTEEQAAAKFGVTVGEMKAFLAMKAAAAEAQKAADEAKAADAQAAKELAEEEAALAAMGDSTKSDNDTE